MKRQLFILAFLGIVTFSAQSQTEIGKALFKHLEDEALILTKDALIQGKKEIKEYVTNFSSSNGKKNTYKKDFSIVVNTILEYEIGEIQTTANSFPVMFIKQTGDPSGAKIEFLVIYQKEQSVDESSNIDQKRNKWMELCNTHQASELVKQLYTANAYYYNQGRLLRGTTELSNEYSYMNDPAYSLKLTPKHLIFVAHDIAYEIGRCSGSYPYPYMLLWEKQAGGNWQIMMDSNY